VIYVYLDRVRRRFGAEHERHPGGEEAPRSEGPAPQPAE